MHLPGSHWKEINLASAVHVLELLAMNLPGSSWKGINLDSAVHVIELLVCICVVCITIANHR